MMNQLESQTLMWNESLSPAAHHVANVDGKSNFLFLLTFVDFVINKRNSSPTEYLPLYQDFIRYGNKWKHNQAVIE